MLVFLLNEFLQKLLKKETEKKKFLFVLNFKSIYKLFNYWKNFKSFSILKHILFCQRVLLCFVEPVRNFDLDQLQNQNFENKIVKTEIICK